MILIDKTYSKAIKLSFRQAVVDKALQRRASFFTRHPAPASVINYFSDMRLLQLAFAPPPRLGRMIRQLHDRFPVLKERYLPKLFFADFPCNPQALANFTSLDLRSERTQAQSIASVLETQLTAYNQRKGSQLITSILTDQATSPDLATFRNAITSFTSCLYGTGRIDASVFPAWVNNLDKLFNYGDVTQAVAVKLINHLDITICPYCNQEEIEKLTAADGSVDYRPAIDHFYPKALYPFLGISLYNFVPSCDKCNSNYKKEIDTFHNGYAHPFLYGVSAHPLIDFDYDPLAYMHGNGRMENLGLSVIPQGTPLDNNLKTFSIQIRYRSEQNIQNLKDYAELAFSAGAYTTILNGNSNCLTCFLYHPQRPALRHQHKKLKYDFLRCITPLNPQF